MQFKSKMQKQRGWYECYKTVDNKIVHCFIKYFKCPIGFLKYFDIKTGHDFTHDIRNKFTEKYNPHTINVYVNHEYNTINVEVQFNTIESRSKQLYELDKWQSWKLAEYRKYVSEQKIQKYLANV